MAPPQTHPLRLPKPVSYAPKTCRTLKTALRFSLEESPQLEALAGALLVGTVVGS